MAQGGGAGVASASAAGPSAGAPASSSGPSTGSPAVASGSSSAAQDELTDLPSLPPKVAPLLAATLPPVMCL